LGSARSFAFGFFTVVAVSTFLTGVVFFLGAALVFFAVEVFFVVFFLVGAFFASGFLAAVFFFTAFWDIFYFAGNVFFTAFFVVFFLTGVFFFAVFFTFFVVAIIEPPIYGTQRRIQWKRTREFSPIKGKFLELYHLEK
jgi:zinc transporter ZupT